MKTGTTQQYRDDWTIGYTPQYTVGVWVGNNDYTPMRNLSGVYGAGPLWKNIMERVHEQEPVLTFTKPLNIVEGRLCRLPLFREEDNEEEIGENDDKPNPPRSRRRLYSGLRAEEIFLRTNVDSNYCTFTARLETLSDQFPLTVQTQQ